MSKRNGRDGPIPVDFSRMRKPGTPSKPVSGVLVPPSAGRVGDPPTRCAELALYDWGPNTPEAARALLELAEKPATHLIRIEVEPPFRTLLPGVHYEPEHPLVQDLASTGCRFSITCYAWVCPEGETDSKHFCSPTCSVLLVTDTFHVPKPDGPRLLTW